MIATIHADPVGVIVAFGAGILSFVSPCVLPLVPAYIGLVAGVRTGDLSEGRADLLRIARATVLFVAGFTAVFVLLGAAASSVGSALDAHRRVLEAVAGVVTIAVGLLFVSGASPSFLAMERRFHLSPSALGGWAPPALGAAFAFGWTPCIGPVLGAVLSEAAARDSLTGGTVLLAAYSLGLGVPFVAFGLATGRLAAVADVARRHYRPIALAAGVILAAWGALMVAGDVTVVSSWFAAAMRFLHLDRLAVS